MTHYDIDKMKDHELGSVYQYNGYNFYNIKLGCGCIIAVLFEKKPSKEEQDRVVELFVKIDNCRTFLHNETNLEKIDYFYKELVSAQKDIKLFIMGKQQQYNIDRLDYNEDHFYIKLVDHAKASMF
jgi:hypothetical protein